MNFPDQDSDRAKSIEPKTMPIPDEATEIKQHPELHPA